MYLTRRDDLSLYFEPSDMGIDLLVTVKHKKKGQRMFGVELRGAKSPTTLEGANKVLYPSVQKMLRYEAWPYPVVLIFFTMTDNKGYITWLSEPVADDHEWKLKRRETADCHELTTKELDGIIDKTHRYFDFFYTHVAV